jgi:hypothetical protein
MPSANLFRSGTFFASSFFMPSEKKKQPGTAFTCAHFPCQFPLGTLPARRSIFVPTHLFSVVGIKLYFLLLPIFLVTFTNKRVQVASMTTQFRPLLDLSAPGLIAALHDGLIQLQPGQWVRFSRGAKPSRFLGATRHTIFALHDVHAGRCKEVRNLRSIFKSRH